MAAKTSETLSDILFALGTWVAGDHSPHPKLALAISAVGFIGTFFPTVVIEEKVLKYFFRKSSVPQIAGLKSKVRAMNIISYAGLIFMMVGYYLVGGK